MEFMTFSLYSLNFLLSIIELCTFSTNSNVQFTILIAFIALFSSNLFEKYHLFYSAKLLTPSNTTNYEFLAQKFNVASLFISREGHEETLLTTIFFNAFF